MAKQEFGGPWTEEKLSALHKYLVAYRKIFTSNVKASRHFHTIYVDAFAGSGERAQRIDNSSSNLRLPLTDEEEEVEQYLKGSARIALDLESPFDEYVFIDKRRDFAERLRATIENDYASLARRCDVKHGDANEYLRTWCAETNWKSNRAVVFLDPYGMNVEWDTIKAIAETRAIDLWLLFPLGSGLNRLLTKNHPPPEDWQNRLDKVFGDHGWFDEFYKPAPQLGLLLADDQDSSPIKSATWDSMSTYVNERLKSVFTKVSEKPMVLMNSRNNPLYLLCFAAGNERGADTAVRIASHLLGGTR